MEPHPLAKFLDRSRTQVFPGYTNMRITRKRKKTPCGHRLAAVCMSPTSPSVGASCLALEPRIMFDGAAVATVEHAEAAQLTQNQSESRISPDDVTTNDTRPSAPTGEPHLDARDQALVDALAVYDSSAARQEIVFVSPSVRDYQHLLDGISPNVEVFVLDPARDGVEQMAQTLADRTGIDAIHLISHGAEGRLDLGTARLTLDSMTGEHADDLAVIAQALSENADLLIYGCSFGLGEQGAEAALKLGQLTGADVAASTDNTGHSSLGGDWDLEFSMGPVETPLIVTRAIHESWLQLMATEDVLDNFGSVSYGNNDGTQSWSAGWVETEGGGAGPGAGEIRVSGGTLLMDVGLGTGGNTIHREVNLTGALSATLSYSYTQSLALGGTVEVQISDDGGANYTTLQTYTSLLPAGGTGNFDVTAYISANTRVRFEVTGAGLLGNIQFDDVHISYVTNDPPVITNLSGDSLSYTEGDGAVVLEQGGNATVSDATSVNFDTGTLTVSFTTGSDAAEDVLAIRNQGLGAGQIGVSGTNVKYGGTTIGTFAGGSGGSNLVITMNSNATPAAAQALIRNITYQDTDTDNPTPGARTVRFVLTDGDGGSSGNHDTTVTVSAVNDAPAITSNGAGTTAAVNAAESQTGVTTVTSTDVDGNAPVYTIVGGADAALFTLNATTGVLTFANVPDFENPIDADSNNIYQVTVQISDGNGGTDTQDLNIAVTDFPEVLSPTSPLPGGMPSPAVSPSPVHSIPVHSIPVHSIEVSPPPGAPTEIKALAGPSSLSNNPSSAQSVSQGPVEGVDEEKKSPGPTGASLPVVRELRGPFNAGAATMLSSVEEGIRKITREHMPGEAPAPPLSEAFRKTLSYLENDLRQATDLVESRQQFVIRTANMGGFALTAGVVAWLLRSGFFLASLAATLPAWRHFDPLPVALLGGRERRKRKADMAAAIEHENKRFQGIKGLFDNKGDANRSDGGGPET